MDQVDSLNEVVLQSTPITSVSVSNVANTSQVIAVTGDLPSFQYFISEQAKSMLALQELQNEVGALLEFRDLVMEAFPQLGQKVQNMQLLNAISPSKWEPGIRVKRKLGQQLRGDSDIVVPSLLPRYRSNSQGKASSRSGEISGSATSNSSSAIQDSGFCTESSKDHSALSSRSKSRDTTDELFSLLDNIHNKGTRLKLEVEYLWSRLNNRRDESCGSLGGGEVNTKRRCKSLDDLIVTTTHTGGGNSGGGVSPSFTFEYAIKTAFLESELRALKRERDTLLKKLKDVESEHMANEAHTNRLLTELETMSAEKRELEQRLQVAIHSENDDDGRVNDLHANFLTRNRWRNAQTPFAKCQLRKLEQVFRGSNQGTGHDDDNVCNATKHAVEDNVSAVGDANATLANTVRAICTPAPATAVAAAAISQVDYDRARPDAKVERPVNPVTKELLCNATSYQTQRVGGGDSAVRTPDCATVAANVVTLTSTKELGDSIDNSKLDGDICTSLGKPDVLIGFVSGQPSSFDSATSKRCNRTGGALSKEKVLSILNEYDPKTLHCFLLTLSYQVEALNVHVQRISKSRLNIFKQLSKYKFENEDLKLELKKKEIELEGTKAQKRVLESKRAGGADVKLSYSTSDLMTASSLPKCCVSPDSRCVGAAVTTSAYTCSVSDSALVIGDHGRRSYASQLTPVSGRCCVGGDAGAVGAMSRASSAKCAADPSAREFGDKAIKSGGSARRSCSKIPLKIYSTRLPTAKSHSGARKTLTSFKECSALGPPHSSCISSTSSSSLNHK